MTRRLPITLAFVAVLGMLAPPKAAAAVYEYEWFYGWAGPFDCSGLNYFECIDAIWTDIKNHPPTDSNGNACRNFGFGWEPQPGGDIEEVQTWSWGNDEFWGEYRAYCLWNVTE